jgi:hypothetical protein
LEDLERLLHLSEKLKKKTLQTKREEIIRAIKLYHSLFIWDTHILFARYGSCPLTNLFGEACQDLESSIFSALHVRRKVAMMCLRSSLEQAVFGLYYDEDSKKYQRDSDYRIVGFSQALDETFSRERFKEFNQKFYLKAQMNEIHRDLSAYIHSRGYQRQDWTSSKVMELEILYEEKKALERIESFIQDWFTFLEKIFDVIITCLFLKCTDSVVLEERIPFRLPVSKEEIERMLSKTRLSQLKSIFRF